MTDDRDKIDDGKDVGVSLASELRPERLSGTFLKVSTVKTWDRFRKFQDISPSEFVNEGKSRAAVTSHMPFLGHVTLASNFKKGDGAVHFISHRWSSPIEPDPHGEHLAQIKAEFSDGDLIWYDYSCIPQEPRTEAENRLFASVIDSIPTLISKSWFTVIGQNIESYAGRTWCQFESVCAFHYGSYPSNQDINEQTKWCMQNSRLYRTYADCYKRLPRTKPTGEGAEYLGGVFIEVPDLNDSAFADFKAVWDRLDSSKLGDPPMLWEILRKLFPPRTDDGTWVRY